MFGPKTIQTFEFLNLYTNYCHIYILKNTFRIPVNFEQKSIGVSIFSHKRQDTNRCNINQKKSGNFWEKSDMSLYIFLSIKDKIQTTVVLINNKT